MHFTDRYMKKKKKKKKKEELEEEEEEEEEGENAGYDSTISWYILTETALTAEDAITCQPSTPHSVWAVGFVLNDDGISISSFPSPLSTDINSIIFDRN